MLHWWVVYLEVCKVRTLTPYNFSKSYKSMFKSPER